MSGLRTQLDWCTKAQALLGLTLGLVVVGFFLFGYRPASAKLRELQDQIDSKRRELDRNVAQVRVLPAVTLAVNELRSRVEKYDKQLPRQQELDRFIKDINTMVLKSSLRKVELTPALTPVRGELFAEQPVLLKFEGDFMNVFSFLRQTEEMQRLTRVKELKLKSSDRSGNPGQVEVELCMNIYFSEG